MKEKNVSGGNKNQTHDPSNTRPACCHGSIRNTLYKMGWKTKPIFSANNKDSIIIRPMELGPLHVLGWVRVEYVKKSLYFITGSFNRTLSIQKCHSNIDYDNKEFKRPT